MWHYCKRCKLEWQCGCGTDCNYDYEEICKPCKALLGIRPNARGTEIKRSPYKYTGEKQIYRRKQMPKKKIEKGYDGYVGGEN